MAHVFETFQCVTFVILLLTPKRPSISIQYTLICATFPATLLFSRAIVLGMEMRKKLHISSLSSIQFDALINSNAKTWFTWIVQTQLRKFAAAVHASNDDDEKSNRLRNRHNDIVQWVFKDSPASKSGCDQVRLDKRLAKERDWGKTMPRAHEKTFW